MPLSPQLGLFTAGDDSSPAVVQVPHPGFNPAGRLWDQPFAALDIETTGLSPKNCGVVELGAVRFIPATGEMHSFSMLVNPCRPIPSVASRIHGIYDEHVAGAPLLDQALAELINFLGECPLVLHNSRFDLGFLVPAARRYGLSWRPYCVHDTLALSRQLLRGYFSYSLENLAKALGMEEGGHHRALKDCEYTAKLFIRLLETVDPGRIMEVSRFAEQYGSIDDGFRV